MSWCRRIGWATSRVSLSSPATGSVHTSWCCTATSGIATPAIAPTVGPQMPAHNSTRSHSTFPRSVRTPCTRPSRTSNPVTVTPPSNAAPFASAARASAVAIVTALAIPSVGTWYAPRIVDGIEQRYLLRGLGGGEQFGPFEPVRAREPEPALQLPHPSLGRGDLDPAHPVPARFAVDVQRRVERHRLLGDPTHHPGAVGLEREPRRVRARTPGLEQRSLVEHQHVGLVELGEVIRGRGADDARADDHGPRPIPHPRYPTWTTIVFSSLSRHPPSTHIRTCSLKLSPPNARGGPRRPPPA